MIYTLRGRGPRRITDVDKATWRTYSQQFIAIEKAEATAAVPAINKHHRLSSFDLQCQIDWQFTIIGVNGWKRFRVEDNIELPLSKRPRVTCCFDSVNSNCTVASYNLVARPVRAFFLFDILHRVWRAMWNGTAACAMQSVITLLTQVCNSDKGPWNMEGNRNRYREECKHWLEVVEPDCNVFE